MNKSSKILNLKISINLTYNSLNSYNSYAEYSKFFFYLLLLRYYLKKSSTLLKLTNFKSVKKKNYSVNKSVFVNNKARIKLIELSYTSRLSFLILIKHSSLFYKPCFFYNNNLLVFNQYLDDLSCEYFNIKIAYFSKSVKFLTLK